MCTNTPTLGDGTVDACTQASPPTTKNRRPAANQFDAEIRYAYPSQINTDDLARWLKKSEQIQWDYKNIAKRRGVLERLR